MSRPPSTRVRPPTRTRAIPTGSSRGDSKVARSKMVVGSNRTRSAGSPTRISPVRPAIPMTAAAWLVILRTASSSESTPSSRTKRPSTRGNVPYRRGWGWPAGLTTASVPTEQYGAARNVETFCSTLLNETSDIDSRSFAKRSNTTPKAASESRSVMPAASITSAKLRPTTAASDALATRRPRHPPEKLSQFSHSCPPRSSARALARTAGSPSRLSAAATPPSSNSHGGRSTFAVEDPAT